ncbi:MAG: CDP-glycerol glycerophosphotransferase family protein [Chloroflexi bacterium]|nr:CDP-glycerol glycerophosphotransferase family protein [Chloroflexota bacterium]
MRLDPTRFTLRPVGVAADDPDDGEEASATVRGAGEGDRIRLRINVMQGPGLLPLSVGRWRLLYGDAPARVVRPDAVDPLRDATVFAIKSGPYGVTPSVGADGCFVLDVTHVAATRDKADSEPDSNKVRRSLAKRTLSRAGRRARVSIFHAMVRAVKAVVDRSGRRILFTSDSRVALTGNLMEVHDRMVRRGLDQDYQLTTLFKSSVAERRSIRDRLRMPWLLATADVIVIDDYQPIIYRIGVDPDVRIIQLWHASGAFKTVGYSRVGKPGGPSPFSEVHKNYTNAIVSSEHDVPFYAEAFGIPEERVVPTGIPRMDRFFDEAARAAGLHQAREEFPQLVGRMTILFAPTFRGDGPRTASYDLGQLDYERLHALAVEKDAVVIMKMHPFVLDPLAIPAAFRDRIIDGSTSAMDVNDLLFAVDLLITDYSSIVFEFSTLGRPMLFFAYDLGEYIASRDFYVPFETFVPGRVVTTFDALLDAIRRDDYEGNKVAAFAARHFAHLDGGSTDRVIDELIIAS